MHPGTGHLALVVWHRLLQQLNSAGARAGKHGPGPLSFTPAVPLLQLVAGADVAGTPTCVPLHSGGWHVDTTLSRCTAFRLPSAATVMCTLQKSAGSAASLCTAQRRDMQASAARIVCMHIGQAPSLFATQFLYAVLGLLAVP